MTGIVELNEFGQSVWLDNISRSLLNTGKLKEMIGQGLRGMTSNPTIFDKSISSSSDYDEEIAVLCRQQKSTFEIYDDLTVKDIRAAAGAFMPVYEKTKGLDGYVSLEVNPQLAYEADKTIEEAKRLHKKVNCPNVMFKIPATKEGFKAVIELIASGINVNATLIFSLDQYLDTAAAYITGIRQLFKKGGDASRLHSVASVFVSRIDTTVDKKLDEKISAVNDASLKNKLNRLKGKAAVANSHLIYENFIRIFSLHAFDGLKDKGANVQRVLWASTSTKNPAYSDIKYVSELIAKNTVNTLPQNTFGAFLDHGIVKEALTKGAESAHKIIKELSDSGIDINSVCDKLLEDGVAAFMKSFESLLQSIEKKASQTCKA